MTDRILPRSWDQCGPGDCIRFATLRFVKFGRVVDRQAQSLRVQLFDEERERVIPMAEWYFDQDPDSEEHLCVVEYRPMMRSTEVEREPAGQVEDLITVNEAVELLEMDHKKLRRFIRRGVIRAYKEEEKWIISRCHLMEVAARHGWV